MRVDLRSGVGELVLHGATAMGITVVFSSVLTVYMFAVTLISFVKQDHASAPSVSLVRWELFSIWPIVLHFPDRWCTVRLLLSSVQCPSGNW